MFRRSDALAQEFPIQDLHCYNLPFGALGFVSHILTYYTLVCLWYGRKPLWPFKPLNNSKLDLVLGSVGVGLCIVMSLITIVNCRNIWQLLLIAIWKLSMSLLSGLTALHVAIMVFNNPERDLIKTHHSAWWIVGYVPGMLAGMIGLMNLVVKVADQTPELLNLTIAFYCIVGAALIVTLVYSICVLWLGGGSPFKVLGTGCLITVAAFVVLSALYSDWALGIMLDSLLGTPSGDNTGLYWTYFIAKRLTLFSL